MDAGTLSWFFTMLIVGLTVFAIMAYFTSKRARHWFSSVNERINDASYWLNEFRKQMMRLKEKIAGKATKSFLEKSLSSAEKKLKEAIGLKQEIVVIARKRKQ